MIVEICKGCKRIVPQLIGFLGFRALGCMQLSMFQHVGIFLGGFRLEAFQGLVFAALT